MSSKILTRVCSIKPGIKETKNFGVVSKYYTVVWIVRTLKSLILCPKLKLSKLFCKYCIRKKDFLHTAGAMSSRTMQCDLY